MAKLPSYAKALLLQGASITGNFTDGYHFIEERLQVRHGADLFRFCKWIDARIGGAASGNIDMLYAAYRNPGNPELAAAAEELAQIIKRIKNI